MNRQNARKSAIVCIAIPIAVCCIGFTAYSAKSHWKDPLGRQGYSGLEDVSKNQRLASEVELILKDLSQVSSASLGLPAVMTKDLSAKTLEIGGRTLNALGKKGHLIHNPKNKNDTIGAGHATWADGQFFLNARYFTYPPFAEQSYLDSIVLTYDTKQAEPKSAHGSFVPIGSFELGKTTTKEVEASLGKPGDIKQDEKPSGPYGVVTTLSYYGRTAAGETLNRLVFMFNQDGTLVILSVSMWGLKPINGE
jgi:hypothetical protein